MMPARRKGTAPTKAKAAFIPIKESKAAAAAAAKEDEWEVRPCGMLVQKRDPDSAAALPVPTIRVRVKHCAVYHEIYLSSQATFGELKKLLSARTGLHPQDQKVIFKDKERDSNAYLDISGVKDGSKMVVTEDATAQAKRFLEVRRQAKIERTSKSISQISLEVDKLATQVSALETIISKGGRVAEKEVLSLIELLMTQLVKLDGIVAVDDDLKRQRRMQETRVQKYVETLDVLKIKNAMPRAAKEQTPAQQPQKKQQQQPKKQSPPSVVVTTKWETFDLLFSPTAVASSTTTSASANSTVSSAPTPRLDWELF